MRTVALFRLTNKNNSSNCGNNNNNPSGDGYNDPRKSFDSCVSNDNRDHTTSIENPNSLMTTASAAAQSNLTATLIHSVANADRGPEEEQMGNGGQEAPNRFTDENLKLKRAKWTNEQEAQLLEDVNYFLKTNPAKINISWIEILKNNPIFKDKSAKQLCNKYTILTHKKKGLSARVNNH